MALSVELTEYFENKLTGRACREMHSNGVDLSRLKWENIFLMAPISVRAQLCKQKRQELEQMGDAVLSRISRFCMRSVSVFSSAGDDVEMTEDPRKKFAVADTPEKSDVEVNLCESFASIPVFRPLSPRAIAFLIFDTIANYLLLYSSSEYAAFSAFFVFILIVYYIFCLFYRPAFVNETYHGNIMNSFLGLRCDCAPAKYMSSVPTLVVLLTVFYKFAVWLLMAKVYEEEDDLGSLSDCSIFIHHGECNFNENGPILVNATKYDEFLGKYNGTFYCALCDGSVAITILTLVVPFFAMLEIYVIFSTYSDLTSYAQMGVLIEAKKVEKFHHPLTEQILTKSELQYGTAPDFSQNSPLLFTAVLISAFAIAATCVAEDMEIESDGAYGRFLSFQELMVYFSIMGCAFLLIYAMGVICYSLHVTYHGCFCRLLLIGDELGLILSEAITFTQQEVGAIPKNNSIEDVNFCARLQAWFRAKKFFSELVFPLSFSLCSLSFFSLIITLFGTSILTLLRITEETKTMSINESLESHNVEIVMCAWNAGCILIIITEASKMYSQNQIQVQRMKEFLLEAKLSKQELHVITQKVRSGSIVENPTLRLMERNSWWLGNKNVNDGDNDDNDDENSGSGLVEFCRAIEEMIVYCDQYNSAARVLGVAITPLFVTTTIAYMASVGLTVAFSVMKDQI